MKITFLLLVFVIGAILGFTLVSQNNITGAATATCYVNNEPCVCEKDTCQCGDSIISASHCRTENFNNNK